MNTLMIICLIVGVVCFVTAASTMRVWLFLCSTFVSLVTLTIAGMLMVKL